MVTALHRESASACVQFKECVEALPEQACLVLVAEASLGGFDAAAGSDYVDELRVFLQLVPTHAPIRVLDA